MAKLKHVSTGLKLTRQGWESASTHLAGDNGDQEHGRAATRILAAVDSDSGRRYLSDAVCDGVADEVEIQAAVDAMPAYTNEVRRGGGSILLQQGEYTFAAPVNIKLLFHGPVIRGQGWGTMIVPPAAGAFVIGESAKFSYGTVIQDMAFVGTAGKAIKIPNGDSIVIERIKANYIGTLIEALGEAGETNWLVIRDVNAWYIKDYGIDLHGDNMLIEHCQLHSIVEYAAIQIRLTGCVNITIADCNIEVGDRGILVSGGSLIHVLHTLFNGEFNVYALTLGAGGSQVQGCHFHDNGAVSIIVPLNMTDVVVEDCAWTGTVALCIDLDGYGNDGFTARRNSLSGTVKGVLQEDEIAGLRAALGIRVDDAAICVVFAHAHGMATKAWDISKRVRLPRLFGTPTWGTIAPTGFGKLACTRAGSQYGRWPAVGYDNILDVAGNKTMVWAGLLNFTPDGTTRHLMGLGDCNQSAPPHMGFFYRNNGSQLRFQVQDSAGASVDAMLRDGVGNAWASGVAVVLIGTVEAATGAVEAWYNGTKVATGTAGAITTQVRPLWLNRGEDAVTPDYGDADHCLAAVYDRVLSDDEIGRLTNALLGQMGV